MRNLVKFAGIVAAIFFTCFLIANAQVSQNLIRLSGVSIIPSISSWKIGNSSTNGIFNNITVTSCTGCSGGNGGATSTNPLMATYFVATSTTATSTFNGPVNLNATSTGWSFNHAVFIDGTHYPMTSAGIISAVKTCKSDSSCGTIYIPAGTVVMNNPIDVTGYNNLTFQCTARKTILQIATASIGNFGYSYMFQAQGTGGASDIQIRDCTLDGNYQNMVAPGANQGGGILPSIRWTIWNNYIYDFNYFPVFINYASSTKVLYNEFAGPARGNDNIGGGHSYNVEIAYNQFDPGLSGNVFDNVNGGYYDIHDNFSNSGNGFYVEGMQNVKIHDNIFIGGTGISIKSDSGYNGPFWTNPNNILIDNNHIEQGSVTLTIVASTSPLLANAGNMSITNNYIASSTDSGIQITFSSASTTQWGSNYLVSGNNIYNPNTSGAVTVNTGNGIIHPSGVNIAQGRNIVVSNNTIVDDRATPLMQYGVEIGQTFAASASNEPNHVTVSGNRTSGSLNGNINIVSPTYTTDYTTWDDATSTLSGSGGINLLVGCFAYNGACLSSTPNYWSTSGSNIYNNTGTNVGIGTSTPDYTLTVQNVGGGTLNLLHVGDSTTNSGGIRLLIENRWTGNDANASSLLIQENNSTPRFNVMGSGNVGIGTSTPGTLLSIQGVANFHTATSTFESTGGINLTSGCFAILGSCLAVPSLPISVANGGTASTSQVTNGVNFYDGTYITSGANLTFTGSRLGVGTTSPDSGVSIENYTGRALLHVGDSTNQSNTKVIIENGWNANDNYALLIQRNPSTFQFGVTGAGNVGVGSSTPGSLLSLNNIANFTTATSTFYSTGGINLTSGCFAILGSCLAVPSLPISVANGGTGTTTWQTGSIPYYNGTNFTENNKNLFWDSSTSRLGVGTSSPDSTLSLYTTDLNVGYVLNSNLNVQGTSISGVLYTNSVVLQQTSASTFTDGAGPGITFNVATTAGKLNPIGFFGAIRSGSDKSGALQFGGYRNGSANSANAPYLKIDGANILSSFTNTFVSAATSTRGNALLTLGTSTLPQLYLSDNLAGNFGWTLRSIGNTFYLATSTYSATSSVAALTINPNAQISIPQLVSCNTIDSDANGLLTCGTDETGAGGGAWPFTTTDTNFGVAVQSTSTPEWFKTGLMASSTSYMATSTFYGNVNYNVLVNVIHADGSMNQYYATSSDEYALGNALFRAASSTVKGDSIYLGANTFNIGNNYLDLNIGGTGCVNLFGAGKYATVIKSSYSKISATIIEAGSNCTTKDLSILGTLTSGTFQYPWGSYNFAFASSTLKNVYIAAGSDGVYNGGGTGSSGNLINVTIDSNFDGIVGGGGNFNIYDSVVTASENANYNNISRAIVGGGGGVINSYNTNVNANGSTISNTGYNAGVGTINVYGGSITTSNTSPNDLLQSGSGVLNVAANVLYNSTKTSGVIGHIGIGASATNGFPIMGTNLTIGTTTPFWTLTAASSTGPQIGLVDTTSDSYAWTFRSTGNTLYVATSTANATSTIPALTVNPNGFVGIGTSTPGSLLDVNGTIHGNAYNFYGVTTSGVTGTANVVLSSQPTFTGNATFANFRSNSTVGNANLSVIALTTSNHTASQLLFGNPVSTSTDYRISIRGSTNSTLTFGASACSLCIGQEAYTMGAFGGVATTSLIAQIAINPMIVTGSDRAAITDTATLFVGGNQLGNASTTDGSYALWVANSTSTSRIDGRLAVGTSTPYWPITVASSTGPSIAIGDNTSGNILYTERVINGSYYLSTSSVPYATSSIAVLRFDSNGHLYLPTLSQSASTQTYYACGAATTFEMIWVTTTCLISAEKYKTNIADLDVGLKEFMKLRPVVFNYKPTGNPVYDNNINIKHQQIGLIADEVAKIDSRLVTYDAKGEIQGFNYEQFTAWIAKSVQEQQMQIESLKSYGGAAKRSVEENFQWVIIFVLTLAALYQQRQIYKLKKSL